MHAKVGTINTFVHSWNEYKKYGHGLAATATSISYRPSGREISSLSAYCVCVGHEGRPRAAGPRATRVTYTYAVADKELIERPGR